MVQFLKMIFLFIIFWYFIDQTSRNQPKKKNNKEVWK